MPASVAQHLYPQTPRPTVLTSTRGANLEGDVQLMPLSRLLWAFSLHLGTWSPH